MHIHNQSIVNTIGPQTSYRIPEGIPNHHGKNYLALTFWALGENGALLDGLSPRPIAVLRSGYLVPGFVLGEEFDARGGSY